VNSVLAVKKAATITNGATNAILAKRANFERNGGSECLPKVVNDRDEQR